VFYWHESELQFEDQDQRDEFRRFLEKLLSSTPDEIKSLRFANDMGINGAWNAYQLFSAHLVPAHLAMLNEELFYTGLATESGREEIRWLLNTIELAGGVPGIKRSETEPGLLAEYCAQHPGRPASGHQWGRPYCAPCISGISSARAAVDRHVVPPGCFVAFTGDDSWIAISGTGCAHWVAHQKGIARGSQQCQESRTLRVPDLISGLNTYPRSQAQTGDIWANQDLNHCGIAVAVSSGGAQITIRHDSSRQGGVFDNDFDQHFGGQGSFYR